MILDTMTTEEVLREIKSDSREVKARWRKFSLKSATPFPKCYLHKEEWTFDS